MISIISKALFQGIAVLYMRKLSFYYIAKFHRNSINSGRAVFALANIKHSSLDPILPALISHIDGQYCISGNLHFGDFRN